MILKMNTTFLAVAMGGLLSAGAAFADDGCYCSSREPVFKTCLGWECSSHLDGGGSSPSMQINIQPVLVANQDHYKIIYHNSCNYPIHTAVNCLDLNNQWQTKGWYPIQPGQNAYVCDTRNTVYYIYGQTDQPAGQQKFWTGNAADNHNWNVQGQTVSFVEQRVQHPNGFVNWTVNFNCPQNQPQPQPQPQPQKTVIDRCSATGGGSMVFTYGVGKASFGAVYQGIDFNGQSGTFTGGGQCNWAQNWMSVGFNNGNNLNCRLKSGVHAVNQSSQFTCTVISGYAAGRTTDLNCWTSAN